jgi:cell division protein ZapA (FtsZ GTPase activity inhibitor)
MKSLEVTILGKSYSFFSDDLGRLETLGEELDEELELLQEKYSQFSREHILLLYLLRLRLGQSPVYLEREEKAFTPDQEEKTEQLDLEIDDILNSEF